uniref:E3 ubiquitin-protein ligase listerin n=1 Tax=Mesocestoides corti TaxID=53468 RepID=A0A5K3EQN1_MESCO
MGKGKNASTQKTRTKGNVKPSNSDRSSDFLQRNVFPDGNLSGINLILGDVTTQCPTEPNSPNVGLSSLLPHDQDPIAATLDSDFLSSLRRLEKRNCATKQKALDNLIFLLRQKNGDGEYFKSVDVITASVLPYWPRLYNTLSYDDDRRVRELTQIVMHALAKRIGRKLGSCLKEVVVPWTYATVDAHENIAKAAKIGLDDTFPGFRRGELYRSYSKHLLDECERRIAYLSTELPSKLNSKKAGHGNDVLPPEALRHLNNATQFIAWITSLLPELCQLPTESSQMARFRDVLKRIWPAVVPIVETAKYPPLSAAYSRLLSVLCTTMREWLASEEELLRFTISTCVNEIDTFPERLASANTCLVVFGEKVWQILNWREVVETKLVPMIRQIHTKSQRQALYSNLLPLVSHLPLDLTDTSAVDLMIRLVDTSRQDLLCSLNLPCDTNLRKTDVFPVLSDQGSSVDCLAGLIFFDLMTFAFSYADNISDTTARRWMYREQFFTCLFGQVCTTLAHLARESLSNLRTVFFQLKSGITDLIKSNSQDLSFQIDPVLNFLDQLFASGTDSSGHLEAWCQNWLRDIISFIKPESPNCQNCAYRWLLTFSLIGQIDSTVVVDDALNLLITSVVPSFDGAVLKWTSSMSNGLTKCSLKPISSDSWESVSSRTRRNFIVGPFKELIQVASPQNLFPALSSLVNLLTAHFTDSLSILSEFANVVLSSPCAYEEAQSNMLQSICLELAKISVPSDDVYDFVASLIDYLVVNDKLGIFGASDIIKEYVKLTLDIIWFAKQYNRVQSTVGEELVTYLKTLETSDARLLTNQVWNNVLSKLGSCGCPENYSLLLAFLYKLPIEIEACYLNWLNFLSQTVESLVDQVETIGQHLPLFIQPEGFPTHLLSQISRLIVAIQVGFKLNLHTTSTVGSSEHKQLASVLLTIQFWLSMGTLEPFTLVDLSPSAVFLPTNVEEAPSVGSLLSFINGVCSEVVDAAYGLESLPLNNYALRASLAKRLVDVHPLQWPIAIRQAASCYPSSNWLEEQLTGSCSEDFLRLCEVYLPAGVLRRCLPRSEVVAHILSLASKEFLDENREGLARLAELIASLSSVAFVGGSYAFSLAPLTLDGPLRDALVDIENYEEPELLRAVVASTKALQVLVLLRQPVGPPDESSRRGLALMSLRCGQLKPRLTRDQWDSLLCLTASWLTQAGASTDHSTPFSLHAFQLVAAIGALFVSSLCSSKTVTAALFRRDMAKASSVDQLMDMNREEWDETDFDFVEVYDSEDDGSVPPIDFEALDQAAALVEDDILDADNEELTFEDPIACRRLPPPASIQKDWHEFFAGNIYGCLIPLAANTCLCGDKNYVSKDTPSSLASLCAAVSTCSVNNLITCLEQQPDIVVTYLLESPTRGCKPPQVTNSVFFSECLLAPHVRNVIDLCVRFLNSSPYQAGQLLGHILLTRLVSSRSLEPVRRMSDVLIPHLPISWVSVLTEPLSEDFENILLDSDMVVSQWGRGLFSVSQLLGEDAMRGHQRLLSYLLAWDVIVSLLSSASQQSRASLQAALLTDANWIHHLCRLLLILGLLMPTQGEIKSLLNVASRLEPDPRLLLTSSARAKICSGLSSLQSAKSVFAPPDRLVQLPGHRLPHDLSCLAVRLLRRLLAESPALMRSLYAELQRGVVGERITPGQARQLAGHLERLVRRHFSVDLISSEVESVERKASEFKRRLGAAPYLDAGLPSVGSIDVRGRPLSREIITTYHFSSDQSLEMVITLPENFPLSPVNVEAGHKTGAPTSNWRAWIVHLSVFINNQNGSILDGIGLWLRNLKKKFDGIEDCAICYSVIHDRNFSFPRMQCRVCKKRFHNECMYRYFQTSRNPTCPLCRSVFYATN